MLLNVAPVLLLNVTPDGGGKEVNATFLVGGVGNRRGGSEIGATTSGVGSGLAMTAYVLVPLYSTCRSGTW